MVIHQIINAITHSLKLNEHPHELVSQSDYLLKVMQAQRKPISHEAFQLFNAGIEASKAHLLLYFSLFSSSRSGLTRQDSRGEWRGKRNPETFRDYVGLVLANVTVTPPLQVYTKTGKLSSEAASQRS